MEDGAFQLHHRGPQEIPSTGCSIYLEVSENGGSQKTSVFFENFPSAFSTKTAEGGGKNFLIKCLDTAVRGHWITLQYSKVAIDNPIDITVVFGKSMRIPKNGGFAIATFDCQNVSK